MTFRKKGNIQLKIIVNEKSSLLNNEPPAEKPNKSK